MCADAGGGTPGTPRVAARVAVDRDVADQRRAVDRMSADVASLKDTVNHLLDRTADVVHKGALQAALSMKVSFQPVGGAMRRIGPMEPHRPPHSDADGFCARHRRTRPPSRSR